MPLGKVNDPQLTGGFSGSPADRILQALNRRIVQPAGREFRKFMRGDAMSGDLSLQDMAQSRPAKALVRGGEIAAEGFRDLENFANKNVPRVERGIKRFIDRF